MLKHLIEGFASIGEGIASLTICPPPSRLEEIFPYYSANAQQRDAQALAEDWRKVGQDMETAIKKFERYL